MNSRRITILSLILAVVAVLAMASSAQAAFGIDADFKQVKTVDSPVVYYLDHAKGLKKAYINESAYLSYGNKWSDIKIVSQSELDKWPAVHLVKTKSSPAVYYISGSKKALIRNENEFRNYGFKWEDIIFVSEADLASYALTNFAVAGGNDSIMSEGSVFVSLDASSPAEQYLSLNTKDNLVAVVNFQAGDEMARINGLTMKFEGVFDSRMVERVYLEDNSGEKYGYDAFINDRIVEFNLSNSPLVISPNSEKVIRVYVDLGSTKDDVASHSFWILLKDSSYINTEAEVSGNFPLKAGVVNLIDGADILGQIKAEQQSTVYQSQEAVVGNTDQLLAKYKISEISGNEDILIEKLILKNRGTVVGSEIGNFKLKDKNNRIVAQVDEMKNGEIEFELDDYKINKNSYNYFTIYGDVLGGEGKAINLQLYNIKAWGELNGFGLPAEINNLNESLSVVRESLGVISLDAESNSKVFKQQAGSIIGLFEIRNNNQDITLEDVEISMVKSSSALNLTETIYLINYDTGDVVSYDNGAKLNNGLIVFGMNNMALESKDELRLALVTEMPEGAMDGDIYQIILNKITYRAANGEYYYDKVNTAGKNLVISKSDIYVYPNNEIGESTYTKGEKKVKIASFIVEASAGADANITSLTLVKGNTSGSVTYNNGFSNLKVYFGSKRIGNIIKKPYGDSFIFDNFSYKLKAEKRIELKVYADIDSELRASETQLKLTNLVATEYNSGMPANVYGLNTVSHKTAFGEIDVEIEALSGGRVYAGEDGNLVASFKVKNTGDEIFKLRYLTLETYNDAFSYSLGYSDLSIVDKEKDKRVGKKSKPVAGANKISMGNYVLDINSEAIFDIYVDAGEDVPAASFQIYFKELEVKGKNSKIEFTLPGNQSKEVEVAGGRIDSIDSSSEGVISSDEDGDDINSNDINFIWPVLGDVTYGFQDPDYPYAEYFEHTGIDIEVDQGTEVKASAGGIVTSAYDGGDDSCSYIIIKHNDSLKTVYGHVSAIYVRVGDNVSQGQMIGLSGGEPGTSGAGEYSNGPHLHFEVWLDNIAQDPMNYLD